MPLPSSGTISISDINTELGRTSNTANSNFAGGTTPQTGSLFKLGETGCINQTASHKMSEWYGYPFCSQATDLGPTTIGSVNVGLYAPNSSASIKYDEFLIGYTNPSLNLNSTSYTAGGVSAHGSLTTTSPTQLNGNTITAVGTQYIAWRAGRSYLDTDFQGGSDGFINNWFKEVYLYVKGTSTAITTWSNLTFTGVATSSGSGYAFYVPSTNTKILYLKVAYSDEFPNVGATITGTGMASNTIITGIYNLSNGTFEDPQRFIIQVSNSFTPTLNATYSYTGIPIQTNTYSRSAASLTTGTFAYGGGSSTDGFLLYKWTSNLGIVDDGGISLARNFNRGSNTGTTEITIS